MWYCAYTNIANKFFENVKKFKLFQNDNNKAKYIKNQDQRENNIKKKGKIYFVEMDLKEYGLKAVQWIKLA
jgi:hypothetical protein